MEKKNSTDVYGRGWETEKKKIYWKQQCYKDQENLTTIY